MTSRRRDGASRDPQAVCSATNPPTTSSTSPTLKTFDSGHPDGAAAWRIFEDRNVKPDYDNLPNFAVVPRSR